ncbi:MAG: leucyl/phenylalanyl-tRNA--protein transferase [Candidatus Promineofilum sp.]|nr:leucyl/phenylalanyl-tRNA--protein transferase [Promineifilum sp.]
MSLSAELLISAYAQGIFPMAHEDGQIYWYAPDPRAILPLDGLHVSRSLMRLIRSGRYEIRFNTAFLEVMMACAAPGPDREETWINDEIIEAYNWLHELGFAHSVEAWEDGALAGGLYGVGLRGLFAGESMFSRRPNASKVALCYLVQRLRERGFRLLDVQFMTPHLRRLGAVEISKRRYLTLLNKALAVDARFD